MTTALELLVAGRELISDVGRWTRDALARLPDGRKVEPSDPDACKWCALGAIHVASKNEIYSLPRYRAIDLLNEAAGKHVAYLNDGPDGHARVLRAYDIAIERARAKEAGG